MKTQEGMALLKQWEALRLHAYLDGGGVPTIGWGHTAGVRMGDTCTQEQAEAWVEAESSGNEAAVAAMVVPSTTPIQLDAMTVLTYNIGKHGFETSTVRRKHNAGDFAGAAAAFLLWDKDNGVFVQGLLNRREAEADLYQRGL